MPTHHGQSRFEVRIAPTTPESARIEPTERSMPAEEITKVMPIASTPNTDVDRRMLRMLETERNAFESIAIIAERTTRTTSDSSRSAAPPAKRARQDEAGALFGIEAIRKKSPRRSRTPSGRAWLRT